MDWQAAEAEANKHTAFDNPENLPALMEVDHEEADAPLPAEFEIPSDIPPLASDSDSDSNAPDVIPGTRFAARSSTNHNTDARTTVYDQEEHEIVQSLGEKACPQCIKRPKRACKQCGCRVCGGKDQDDSVVCDDCGDFYHSDCLEPTPQGGDWHCPRCTKKPHGLGQRPIAHFGPIPGVEVGQTYQFRAGASQAGVHRPTMAGISGSAKQGGSSSIVLSAGYKDDVDQGDTFIYSGAGGRITKKTGSRVQDAQSFDQTLDKYNAALAITMFPDLQDPEKLPKEGAVALDWTKSKPVRVIRSEKMGHSNYAPKKGFRYDGIYKLVRYWPEKGKDGFITYKYELRRDDPNPPPWTEEGKARIQELGLKMVCGGPKKRKQEDLSDGGSKRRKEEEGEEIPGAYELDPHFQRLIGADAVNQGVWKYILGHHGSALEKIVRRLMVEFTCPVCGHLVLGPVTLKCGHTICQGCLTGSNCPKCNDERAMGEHINSNLIAIIAYLDPTYEEGGR